MMSEYTLNPAVVYFLKVNGAFVLFYAFYRLFFYKDTFFKLRRALLLAFFGAAFLYPLLNLQEWIKEQAAIDGIIHLYSGILLPEAKVTAGQTGIDEMVSFWAASAGLYLTGILFLFIRFGFQLGSILRLAHLSKKFSIQGTPVYVLPEPAGPFSFFRMIFLYPADYSEMEIAEILVHEKTHVSQGHSFDVLLCELISIVCWMNPFVWLLKREVRHNLEYLADHRVIQSGYDSKSYQHHLLGLAHHQQAAASLYNSFHVLHLKNRIRMMNKKRSRGIGRTKYLMLLPLIALLMVLSNVEGVARLTLRTAGQPALFADPVSSASLGESLVGMLVVNPTDSVYTTVEHMPVFPGGDRALLEFINRNIRYPMDAQKAGVEGRVICSFVVEKDGTVSTIEIVRSLYPSLDEEAKRVIRSFPTWKPGMDKGKAVRVLYTVPITYRLE